MGSVGLVLRVVFLVLVASLLLSAGAPAATSPDYRCCFRLDALMTGRLDTVYESASAPSDDEQATWTFRTSELVVYSVTGASPQLRRAFTLRVEVGSAVADIGAKADRACDETHHGVRTGPLDGLSAGGPTSHLLVPPTRARFATLKSLKLRRVRRFGKDVVHNPILSGLIPHKTTGFVLVEICLTHVSPNRVKSEAARISALVGKVPAPVSSLRCG